MNKIRNVKKNAHIGGRIYRYCILLCSVLSLTMFVQAVQAEEVNLPNFFSTKVNVNDLEKAVDFYTNIMGLKVAARVGNDSITEVVLTRGGEGVVTSEQALILFYTKDREVSVSSGSSLNNLLFVFPDLTECLRRLDAAGIPVTGSREPMPAPPAFGKAVTILFTKDPDGNVVELVQYHF